MKIRHVVDQVTGRDMRIVIFNVVWFCLSSAKKILNCVINFKILVLLEMLQIKTEYSDI